MNIKEKYKIAVFDHKKDFEPELRDTSIPEDLAEILLNIEDTEDYQFTPMMVNPADMSLQVNVIEKLPEGHRVSYRISIKPV